MITLLLTLCLADDPTTCQRVFVADNIQMTALNEQTCQSNVAMFMAVQHYVSYYKDAGWTLRGWYCEKENGDG